MGLDHLKRRKPEAKAAKRPPTPAKPKEESKGGPPAEAPEKISHKCGHAVKASHYASGDCQKCAGERRRAKARAKREAWEAKKKGRDPDAGRLPHGSAFNVHYNAELKEWSGGLTVPNVGTFAGSAAAVFSLLSNLDQSYRKAVSPTM